MARRHDDPQQLGLFGPLEAPATPATGGQAGGAPIGPATPTAELVEVARQLPATIRLGTSSWSFPGWRGLVYDRDASEQALARGGLAAYARHPLLRTVGIDRTYYAPISAAEFARYAAETPADFSFLAKAHEALTSPYLRKRDAQGVTRAAANAYLFDAAYARDKVVQPFVEGLGTRAGPLVFQFPPLSKRALGPIDAFVERLHTFLSALPRGPMYAVEIRNSELLTAAYATALRDAGVAHCYSIHPALPPLAQQAEILPAEAGGPLVVRWMLHRKWDYEGAKAQYAPFDRLIDEDVETRDALGRLATRVAERGSLVTITVNNKAEGSSPLSVFRLAERIVALRGGRN